MLDIITLIIEGQPIANKRHRSLPRSNIQYDPQKKEKSLVRWQLLQQIKEAPQNNRYLLSDCIYFDEAQFFSVHLAYYMKIPKCQEKFLKKELCPVYVCHKKPDLDNLDKFYLDCMTGIVYSDDARIVRLSSEKVYDLRPRTEITVKAHFREGKGPYKLGNDYFSY